MDTVISEKLSLFCKHVQKEIQLLLNRFGIPFRRSRFEYKGYLYPLHIVTFEHPSRLGYFDREHYTIGINSLFATSHEKLLSQVIQHEVAHLITYLKYGDVPDHGPEFRSICKECSLPSEVSSATVDLGKTASARSKVQKLLALSESSSEAEAISALKKAQTLIEKHGIEPSEDDPFRTRTLATFSRATEKEKTIADVLKTLAVVPVFSYSKKGVSLTIFGQALSIEAADEAFNYLDKLLDEMWK